jgi:uncharacterized protein
VRPLLGAEFATSFVPAGVAAEDPEELDSPDVQSYLGDEIDLNDIVREHVLLGLPMSPVCREDCRGLCPQCGAELNLGPCGCTAPRDPRWNALGDLGRPR